MRISDVPADTVNPDFPRLAPLAALGAAFLVFFSALPVRAETPQVWSWHLYGQEINAPTFSPDGRDVAFTLKRREIEGSDVQSMSAAQLAEHYKDVAESISENPRVFDPVVTVLSPATGHTERIGFGYEPVYSPDGTSLAFQHQKNPISGRRPLAAMLAGNEIWLHDRATGNARMLAAPSSGSLAAPRFAPDGKSVAFTFNETINGSWSGAVGVGRVDLATGAITTSYAPRKVHDLPHIVVDFGFVGEELYAAVMIPQGPGTFMANRYLTQLVALHGLQPVRYSWGDREVSAPAAAFATWMDGRIAVFDYVWKPVGFGSAVKAAANAARGWRSSRGVLSPDGRKIAREFASGIVVSDTVTGRQIVEFPGPNSNDQGYRRSAELNVGQTLDGITWSPDSRRIAWVEDIGYFTWEHETLKIGTLPR